jgi:hypothetical protein
MSAPSMVRPPAPSASPLPDRTRIESSCPPNPLCLSPGTKSTPTPVQSPTGELPVSENNLPNALCGAAPVLSHGFQTRTVFLSASDKQILYLTHDALPQEMQTGLGAIRSVAILTRHASPLLQSLKQHCTYYKAKGVKLAPRKT